MTGGERNAKETKSDSLFTEPIFHQHIYDPNDFLKSDPPRFTNPISPPLHRASIAPADNMAKHCSKKQTFTLDYTKKGKPDHHGHYIQPLGKRLSIWCYFEKCEINSIHEEEIQCQKHYRAIALPSTFLRVQSIELTDFTDSVYTTEGLRASLDCSITVITFWRYPRANKMLTQYEDFGEVLDDCDPGPKPHKMFTVIVTVEVG